jgi:hypothetical protein
MVSLRTQLIPFEDAQRVRFEPTESIQATNVQQAIALLGQQVGGGVQRNGMTTVADSDHIASVTDFFTVFNPLTAARTDTLPPKSSVDAGQDYVVADGSGACSPDISITIKDADSGEIITQLISAFAVVRLKSDGDHWVIG